MKTLLTLLFAFILIFSNSRPLFSQSPVQVTNLQHQCNGTAGQVTLSWNPISGVVYMLRLNDPANNTSTSLDGWYTPNTKDVIANSLTQTSFTASIVPNTAYQWWIHSYNPVTKIWSNYTGEWFKCETSKANSDYILGSVYMNKPATPTHQWNEVQFFNAMPSIKGTSRVRLPALGFYNATDPRVLEWQIQSSFEHGLNYFIFNDYWAGNQTTPVYNTLFPTYLKASNRDRIKFAAALIANNAASFDEVKQNFRINIANYYKNNYFNQQNYMNIDGKPVVYIMHNGVLGDWDPTRINSLLKDFEATAGTEIYWIYMNADRQETDSISSLSNLAAMGFKAIGPYGVGEVKTYPTSTYTGDEYSDIINNVSQINEWFLTHVGQHGLKYIPTASSNFDERPRYSNISVGTTVRSYTKNATLDGYKTILSKIKQLTGQYNDVIPKIDGRAIVNLANYNEWAESFGLEPGLNEVVSSSNQFAVLDAVFQIFGVRGPAPTNRLPDPSITTPLSSQTSWTSDDVDKIFTPPSSTDLVKVSGQNYAKTTISPRVIDPTKAYSYVLQIASNIPDLSQYKSVKLTLKTSCAKEMCLRSIFMGWNTFLPDSQEPLWGNAGVGIGSPACITASDGWVTCTFIPSIATPSTNPDKFIGRMFQLTFTLFVDGVSPVDLLFKEASLTKETTLPTSASPQTTAPLFGNADINNDGKVDINDYNILVADFGKTGTAGFLPADINKNGKVDIFDYNIIVTNFQVSSSSSTAVVTSWSSTVNGTVCIEGRRGKETCTKVIDGVNILGTGFGTGSVNVKIVDTQGHTYQGTANVSTSNGTDMIWVSKDALKSSGFPYTSNDVGTIVNPPSDFNNWKINIVSN